MLAIIFGGLGIGAIAALAGLVALLLKLKGGGEEKTSTVAGGNRLDVLDRSDVFAEISDPTNGSAIDVGASGSDAYDPELIIGNNLERSVRVDLRLDHLVDDEIASSASLPTVLLARGESKRVRFKNVPLLLPASIFNQDVEVRVMLLNSVGGVPRIIGASTFAAV